MQRPADPDRYRSRKRRRWIALAVTVAIAVAAAVRFERFLFRGNFGVVAAGQVYRSGQPGHDLERTLKQHRIASVLNLRGGSRTDWWYANEDAVTRRLGVAFYDLPLEAEREPTRDELLALLDLFEHCRYPLLIHCKSGSDRTGLASALYRLSILGEPPGQARTAFSLDYAHFPLFGPEQLHTPFEAYSAWLARTGQSHTPARFRNWVEQHYRPADRPAEPALAERLVVPLQSGPRAELAIAAGLRPTR